MRTLNKTVALSVVLLSAIFCFAQLGYKKTAPICSKCVQQAAAVSKGDAEDFNLISLLTLKFM